jgi:hypothetical protein
MNAGGLENSSLVIPTIKKSPNSLAYLKSLKCPGCNTLKVPEMKTLFNLFILFKTSA